MPSLPNRAHDLATLPSSALHSSFGTTPYGPGVTPGLGLTIVPPVPYAGRDGRGGGAKIPGNKGKNKSSSSQPAIPLPTNANSTGAPPHINGASGQRRGGVMGAGYRSMISLTGAVQHMLGVPGRGHQ